MRAFLFSCRRLPWHRHPLTSYSGRHCPRQKALQPPPAKKSPAAATYPRLAQPRPQPAIQPAAAGAGRRRPRSRGRGAAVAPKPKEPPPLTTDDEKTVYALGLMMGQSLSMFNLSPAEIEIVKRALSDAAAGKPALELSEWGAKIDPLARSRAAAVAEKQKAALRGLSGQVSPPNLGPSRPNPE